MPCFHFDLRGEPELAREGLQLDGVDEARLEATRLAGGLLAQDPERLWREPSWRLDVTNCDGGLLFSIEVRSEAGAADAIPNEVCRN